MVNALFTDFGSVVATTLHTAGAIAYLAGLVAFVSWARHLREGQHHRNTLALGQTLAYIGILANLFGGFIRTYQPGHPKLWDFGQSGWATAMVVKHAALFVGMALAVYLFEVVAPRMRTIWRTQGSQALPRTAERVAVYGVAASILVASVLGAWSTVLPIAGMDDGDGLDEEGGGGNGGLSGFEGASYSFSGAAQTGSPTQGSFDVDRGATVLDIVFLAVTPAPLFGNLPTNPFVFTLTLTAPDGTVYTNQTDPTATGDLAGAPVPERRIDFTLQEPAVGAWTFQVTADAGAGVGATWELSVGVAGPDGFVLTGSVTKAAEDGFCEINTNMLAGDSLAWNWTTSPHTPIHFDVHTHFDGDVQYLVDDDAMHEHAGNITADRDGGYSLLWENNGQSTVDIIYRITGEFRIHSIVGC